MFLQILSDRQVELLPLVKRFASSFGLVGGTAVALQLGHRRSVDFDLFSTNDFDNRAILKKVKRSFPIQHVYIDSADELTVVVNGVRMTWYHYPYKIPYSKKFPDVIKMPDLLTLAAMKGLTLGRRAKWKDYVDLYFIARKYSLKKIVVKAEKLFGNEFNEKLFREQLSYHADINYSDPVVYLPGFAVSDAVVKKTLQRIAVS